ncbi:MAG: GNAT family N-acetyltransferase, partial [Chthonomonadales bacterium]
EVVIGWCDIVPKKMEGFRHIGTLGMGIKEGYRGQGIGSRLMESTLNRAKEIGLERVELDAFATNTNAIALYKKFGFEVEGVKKAARKLDGIVEDNICMAKLL